MSQPFNSSDPPNGAAQNGSASHHVGTNGTSANGTSANGTSANGTSADRTAATGASVNGLPTSSDGGEARGALPAGAASSGRDLERFSSVPPVAAYPRAPMSNEDDEDTVDLSRYWRALKRRWPVVLKTAGVMLLLGTVWTALQKPVYQSTTILLVSGGGGSGGSGSDALAGLLGGAPTSRSLGQQMLIIRSPHVQTSAIARLNPGDKAQIQGFTRADIGPEPGAEAIDVQVQAHTPQAAAAFANAISDEYLNQSAQQAHAQVINRTSQISKDLEAARRQRDDTADKVRRFQQRHKTVDLPTETQALIAQVTQAQSDERANDLQRHSDEAKLGDVENQLGHLPNYTPTSIVPTPAVEALKARLTTLNLDRIEKSREYTPTSREIRDIDAQIADVNAQLKTTVSQQFGGLGVNPLRQNLLQQKIDLQSSILSSQSKAAALQNAVAQAQDERDRVPDLAYQLGVLKGDQATAQTVLDKLNEQYQSLRAEEEGRVSNASVLQYADPAQSPMIAPRRAFNIIASALLGLMLGALLALLLDRLDDRVHGGEDVAGAAHLPVLAHVPRVRRGAAALLDLGNGAPHNPALVESFRLLRANIAFAGLDEPPRTVAVTSSRAGEGKSTTALNLATVVALSGKSVLLVDCDLRRSALHSLLSLSNETGLSSVAAGMTSLPPAIQATRVPNLRVLTSGPTPPNAPELLDSRRGRAALEAAMESAEFVVFDCPPALGLADAHLVAAMADATLLVVECESTRKREVARASRSLAQAGARILGIVLNKTPVKRGENEDYFQLPVFGASSPNHDAGLLVSTPASSTAPMGRGDANRVG